MQLASCCLVSHLLSPQEGLQPCLVVGLSVRIYAYATLQLKHEALTRCPGHHDTGGQYCLADWPCTCVSWLSVS